MSSKKVILLPSDLDQPIRIQVDYLKQQYAERHGLTELPNSGYCACNLLWKAGHPPRNEVARFLPDRCHGRCIPPHYDHGSVWGRGRRAARLVYQPYFDFGPEFQRELSEWCDHFGLLWNVSAGGWHFPGRALLIEVFTPAEAQAYSEFYSRRWTTAADNVRA